MLKKPKIMHIVTIYNHKIHAGHTCSGVHPTVPDMEMSIKEIMARFANGQTVLGGRPSFFGGEDFEEEDPTQKMGFNEFDALELKNQLDLSIEESKNKQKEAKLLRDAKKAAEKQSEDRTTAPSGSEVDAKSQSSGKERSSADNREAAEAQ